MATALKKYKTKSGKDIPYLYQASDGGFWARKFVVGKDRIKSLGTSVESVAVSKLHSAVADMIDKATNEQSKPKTNLLFRDFYYKMLEQKKSRDTKESTMSRIDVVWRLSLEPFWGNLTPKEICPDLESEFIEWHKKNRPGVQLVNIFKYLGNVLRLMQKAGAIQSSQMPELVLPKTEQKNLAKQKGTFITDEEFSLIRAKFDKRYVLLLDLTYCLGMREMELGKLKCESVVTLKDRVFIDLSVHDTKTGLPRIVPIPKQFEAELLKRKASNNTYMFESPTDSTRHISAKMIFQFWAKAKRDAEVTRKIRFHDLRHTRATILVEQGMNPLLIAAFLGMSITRLQKSYYHLKPESLLVLLKEEGP